ncbi:hypothetical protein N4G62_03200 [Sphingomonas sanguinis]|uniref:Chemotaxis protein n=1 Tax=Sphingomonas sanguinis TaxID=33051 RepID=A0ABU5LMW0_9SPHN|nr:hypothetical protein [Sphingomonas sanguinis]MDZ7281036.1 hypothetical protein [Sphingomonas sanguinis]
MTTTKKKRLRERCPDHGGQTTVLQSQASGRLARLEFEVQTLRTKLAHEAGRVDALSARKPDRLGPIIGGTGAAISSLVAVGGFFLVHHLSVRRQRRDEFFKRMQDCLTIIERVGRDASKVWRRPANDKEAQAALELLQADIDALSYRLARMQKLQATFNVNTAFVELKREATLNVEDSGRAADIARADRVLRLAQNLTNAILIQFDQVYG